MKRLDLKGKKINMLTVIGYSHSYTQPSGQKRAYWDVICDCGVQKKISTSTLTNKTISCGCYIKNKLKSGIYRRIEPGEANFNYKYLSYKLRAKDKNIDFFLSKEEFRIIVTRKCIYCNSDGDMTHIKRSKNGLFISNGIDRVDSKKGYIIENCVSCCKKCNIMKNQFSKDDFFNHIIKIYNHSIKC